MFRLCRLCCTPLPARTWTALRTQSTSAALPLTITNSAIDRLDSLRRKERNPRLALRIAVESGGCHGYQYKLDLEDLTDEHLARKAADDDADRCVPAFAANDD
jgi:Fe-S cluster assembly iron-binding protein IscA